MTVNVIYIFIEGERSDEQFFTEIIKPLIEKNKTLSVNIYPYANKTRSKIRTFLSSLINRNEKFIFTSDLDENQCKTIKKKKIINHYSEISIDDKVIVIIVREIEGWYLAGLSNLSCNALGIEHNFDCNEILKERFKALIPNKYAQSERDFRTEILKHFDINLAKENNVSFKYFVEKFVESNYFQTN